VAPRRLAASSTPPAGESPSAGSRGGSCPSRAGSRGAGSMWAMAVGVAVRAVAVGLGAPPRSRRLRGNLRLGGRPRRGPCLGGSILHLASACARCQLDRSRSAFIRIRVAWPRAWPAIPPAAPRPVERGDAAVVAGRSPPQPFGQVADRRSRSITIPERRSRPPRGRRSPALDQALRSSAWFCSITAAECCSTPRCVSPGGHRRVHFYAPIAEQRQPEAGHERAY